MLGSLLAKQNPSLNETLDEVYKEERRGFSASLGSWPNPSLDGLSFPNTDSKNALKLLVRNYMGSGPQIKGDEAPYVTMDEIMKCSLEEFVQVFKCHHGGFKLL